MRPQDIVVMEWNQKMSEVKVQTRGLQPTRTGWTSRPITESGTSQLVCPAHMQTRPWPNNKLIDPTSIRQTRLAASGHFISFSFFFVIPLCSLCMPEWQTPHFSARVGVEQAVRSFCTGCLTQVWCTQRLHKKKGKETGCGTQHEKHIECKTKCHTNTEPQTGEETQHKE